MKKKELRQDRINSLAYLSFILIGLAVFAFVIIFAQLYFLDKVPEYFGVIGDAVGGVLNPIISIAAALLTFLAFYMQKLANDILKQQFKKNKKDEHIDFVFNNYKSRILLIANEINNFNVSFHGNTLISKIELLAKPTDKKYNFIGGQAINLFLIEFFRIKEEREKGGTKEYVKIDDSSFGVLLQINSTISSYYKVWKAVYESDLKKDFKSELEELLAFIYYSKLNYFFSFLLSKSFEKNTTAQMKEIYDFYLVKSQPVLDAINETQEDITGN